MKLFLLNNILTVIWFSFFLSKAIYLKIYLSHFYISILFQF